ncbi:hypothetical protein H6P81_017816 [Aristolochia fimbriata]|uniref:Uncharacterized protein n=1 Tax=Aristolochia fimbriata TaxID=158543 RepID=A0AAV7E2A6_ARIFI|nr:hypothetical protein H6P81_017816 [Aristolochia fimbriata]
MSGWQNRGCCGIEGGALEGWGWGLCWWGRLSARGARRPIVSSGVSILGWFRGVLVRRDSGPSLAEPGPTSLSPAPFILGKRFRSDDDGVTVAKEVDIGLTGPTAGFWAVPARPDFGQVWSFAAAAPDVMMQPNSLAARFAPTMGEASAARVGNYLPIAQGHLNLLASLSGPSSAGFPWYSHLLPSLSLPLGKSRTYIISSPRVGGSGGRRDWGIVVFQRIAALLVVSTLTMASLFSCVVSTLGNPGHWTNLSLRLCCAAKSATLASNHDGDDSSFLSGLI